MSNKPNPQPGMMIEKFRGEVPAWNSDQVDEPYQAFLDAAKLETPEAQQALAASSDKRFRELLRQINLPKNRNKKYSTLAKIMDISMAEFADHLRSASRTRALSIAAQRLPAITNDMADDAMTQKEACGRCDGWGFVNVTPEEVPPLPEDGSPIPGAVRPMGARWVRDCPQCSGSGKINKPGDSHARASLMLMNGISNKSPAVAVSISNNYGGNGIESAGARLSNITFDLSADSVESIGGDPSSTDERGHSFDSGPVEELNGE